MLVGDRANQQRRNEMTKHETRNLEIRTFVYCNVHGVEGWYRVLGVRPRDGYIKISGYNTWNPPHNFSLTDKNGKTFEMSA
jgi:hypothetical protein